MKRSLAGCLLLSLVALPSAARAEGEWETTPQGEQALARGLEWLAKNQGREGNWESKDLGLVSMGSLAFLSAGHMPGHGQYGEPARRALDYVVSHAHPSGLLNIADKQRGMYNHGLSTFVLGQAYGMSADQRIGPLLDRALRLIAQTQCNDGGWDYIAERQERGHDLSLAVMQAKALRSAVDCGLDVPPEVIHLAIRSVREHYTPEGCPHNAKEDEQRKHRGQFTYTKGGGKGTVAMAAAGVVCLQEFAQYDDWRIEKNMEVITAAIRDKCAPKAAKEGHPPLEAYTLYYVGQALYQVGGKHWKECYPLLRDSLVATQIRDGSHPDRHGMWVGTGHVSGKSGDLYATAVGCFVLAMPNRYLPILQEGKIDTLRKQFQGKP